MLINIELPDDFEMTEQDLKLHLALKLYETGKLSLGQASRLAQLSKTGFTSKINTINLPQSVAPNDFKIDVEERPSRCRC